MGNRVREVRKSIGMSQTFLATQVRRSRGYISNIERGKQIPSVYVSNSIAEILNTTSEFLFPVENVNHNIQKEETK